MTTGESSGPSRLARIRRYRRLMVVSMVAGVLGFVAAARLGYTLVGVAVYWTGCLGFLVVWRGTSVTLFDERDRALEERASHLTLNIVAFASIAGWPALLVLSELGRYEFSLLHEGALLGFTALYVVFGAVYTWLRYRP